MDASPNLAPVLDGIAHKVSEAEFKRTLGIPVGHDIDDRTLAHMDEARSTFSEVAKPWVHTQPHGISSIIGDKISLNSGIDLTCELLVRKLEAAGAHMIVVVAVSAGAEISEHCDLLWQTNRPDEAFILDSLATNVVEQLTLRTGMQLCDWGEPEGMAAVPHYSPGYKGWDILEHLAILPMLAAELPLPGPLEVLESGMLKPKKSQISVFGMTRHTERILRLPGLCPCLDCSLEKCAYRRAPRREKS
jgi:hypothetical protein